MNNFPQHISFLKLADLVEGRLPAGECEEVMAHLAVCIRCANEMAQIENIIKLMETDKSENAPPYLVSRVMQIFRSKLGTQHRAFAIPRFDSKGLSPAFGVRSGDPHARQLLFRAETYDIDLRIEADGPVWVISGQVLGGGVEYGRVNLQSATETKSTILNEQSEFTLPPTKPDHYKLVFYLPNIEIEVGELNVGT